VQGVDHELSPGLRTGAEDLLRELGLLTTGSALEEGAFEAVVGVTPTRIVARLDGGILVFSFDEAAAVSKQASEILETAVSIIKTRPGV
jgi:hypothetical protein